MFKPETQVKQNHRLKSFDRISDILATGVENVSRLLILVRLKPARLGTVSRWQFQHSNDAKDHAIAHVDKTCRNDIDMFM